MATASAASASIAAPRQAFCRPPSPSGWPARICATSSRPICTRWSRSRTPRSEAFQGTARTAMTTSILVTGGAGYIGSHACKALAQAGYTPVTFDNISTGWAEAVKFGPLERGDLGDRARLDAVFARHRPAAVMHFAALSQVGESMKEPGRYWRQNVLGALNLIEAAAEAGCLNFVFSSTCATYGDQ